MTVTASGATTRAPVPLDGAGPASQRTVVTPAYGLRSVTALGPELDALAAGCGAPLTARPAWSLATQASPFHRPWALLASDARGTPVGGVTLMDDAFDPAAVRTTLAGTDGGHRGAILTSDPAVAHTLGEALRRCLEERPSPVAVILGPLPAGCPVVDAFASGLCPSRQDAHDEIPVIRRGNGTYQTPGVGRALRKAVNRLRSDGRRTTTRFTRDAGDIFALLPQLEQVHRHRDHAHGRASSLDDLAQRRTWRRRLRALTVAGNLELAILCIDGELAAYTLGVQDGSAFRLLEGRFVTSFARYSPGRLLETEVVERALAHQLVTTFDWMTAVAPESLLGSNGADPMVVIRLGPASA